jgi:hypothetical protein
MVLFYFFLMSIKRLMILDKPLKRRDDIQQLNKAPIPKSNGNEDSITVERKKDTNNPIQPIARKIFPAIVNDSEIFVSFSRDDNALSSSKSSKRLSSPRSSFIFLIWCSGVL